MFSNSNIEILYHVLDDIDLQEFSNSRTKKEEFTQNSLAEYVKEKFYPNKDILVIPDLSGQVIRKTNNLQQIDFSGAKLIRTKFHNCDLEASIFCDVDLTGTEFINCQMQHCDMRGANLAHCVIRHEDRYNSNAYQNMKFSLSIDLLAAYSKINEIKLKEATQIFTSKNNEDITNVKKKIDYTRSKFGVMKKIYAAIGLKTGNTKYDRLINRLKILSSRTLNHLEVSYTIHPTILGIIDKNQHFDPGYVRDSDIRQEKQYVDLSKKDIKQYLALLSSSQNKTLQQFAKEQLEHKKIKIKKGRKIVPRVKVGTDLSKLDFSGTELQGGCFSGVIFNGCKFEDANLEGSVFAFAEFIDASFENVRADNADFSYCNLGKAKITNSNFSHSLMSGIRVKESKLKLTKFDHADIQNSNWQQADFDTVNFNFSDLTKAVFTKSKMQDTMMRQVILDHAIMDSCKIERSNFTGAIMIRVSAQKINIAETNLSAVKARGISLEMACFASTNILQGADLENASMYKFDARGVNFSHINMAGIKGHFARFDEADLESVNMSFADLTWATLDGADAVGIDLNGSNIKAIKARRVNFKNAIMNFAHAVKADFERSNLKSASLQAANFKNAILKNVKADKANLYNTNLKNADLSQSSFNHAKLNIATNCYGSLVTSSNGNINYDDSNSKQEISINRKKLLDEEFYNIQNKSFKKRLVAEFARNLTFLINMIGKLIVKPFNRKFSKIIGTITGILIAAYIGFDVASAEESMFMGIMILITLITAGGMAGLKLLSRWINKLGLSNYIAILFTMEFGLLGMFIAIMMIVAFNSIIKVLVQKNIDEITRNKLGDFADMINYYGDLIGLSSKQEKLLVNYRSLIKKYRKPKRPITDLVIDHFQHRLITKLY